MNIKLSLSVMIFKKGLFFVGKLDSESGGVN